MFKKKIKHVPKFDRQYFPPALTKRILTGDPESVKLLANPNIFLNIYFKFVCLREPQL